MRIPPIKHIALLFAVCAIQIVLMLLWFPGFLGDDTYIHLAFVKGILQGDGFAFTGNVTNGSTAPLWVLMTAALTFTGIDPLILLRLLSAIFSTAVLLIVYAHAIKAGFSRTLSITCVAVTALNAYFLRWGLSGMETTAAAFFLLSAAYTGFYGKKTHHFAVTGVLFGLGTLLRPEIILFFAMYIAHLGILKRHCFSFHGLKKLAACVSTGLAPLLAWGIYAYYTFENVIPNTFFIKAGGSIFSPTFNLLERNLKLLVSGSLSELFIAGTLVLTLLFWKRVQYPGLWAENLRPQLLNLPSGKVLIVSWIIAFYGYYILKDVIILSRYSLMLSPFIVLGTAWFLERVRPFVRKDLLNGLVLSWLFAAFMYHSFFTLYIVKPASDAFVKGFQQTYTEMAYWLNNYDGEHERSVALTDVGIIGAYSGMTVYDLEGLVDHRRMNYQTVSEYVRAKEPGFIILRDEYALDELLPENTKFEVIYSNFIPGFGINEPEYRNIFLYKIYWDEDAGN